MSEGSHKRKRAVVAPADSNSELSDSSDDAGPPRKRLAASGPRALPKPALRDPLYARGDMVEGRWGEKGKWFRGRVRSEPVWCFGGWRYEVVFDDGGSVTFDPGEPDTWDPATSGQPEALLRRPDAQTPPPGAAGVVAVDVESLNREALRNVCRREGLPVGGSTVELRQVRGSRMKKGVEERRRREEEMRMLKIEAGGRRATAAEAEEEEEEEEEE